MNISFDLNLIKICLIFSQENEIINTNGICEVSLIKSDLMLDVKFSIDGQTDLICDRTLKKLLIH